MVIGNTILLDALPAGSDHNESESSAEDDDADVAQQPAEDRISPSPPPRKAKGKRKALPVPTAESDYNDDEESEPDEDHFSPPPPARKAKGKGKALPVPVDDEDAYNGPPADGSNHDADADADADADYPLTPGRLPQEAIRKAIALGQKVEAEARKIGREYGKSKATILAEAGLSVKAYRAENRWNMHQLWYKINYPKSSDGESYPVPLGCFLNVIIPEDWKRTQHDHWIEHRDESEHPQLWKEIRALWEEPSTNADESPKKLYSRVMAIRDDFARSVRSFYLYIFLYLMSLCSVRHIHDLKMFILEDSCYIPVLRKRVDKLREYSPGPNLS